MASIDIKKSVFAATLKANLLLTHEHRHYCMRQGYEDQAMSTRLW